MTRCVGLCPPFFAGLAAGTYRGGLVVPDAARLSSTSMDSPGRLAKPAMETPQHLKVSPASGRVR